VTRTHSRAQSIDIVDKVKHHDLKSNEKTVTKTTAPISPAIGKDAKRHDFTQALRARRYRMRKAGAKVPKLEPGPRLHHV
jgi:hypothetical protein